MTLVGSAATRWRTAACWGAFFALVLVGWAVLFALVADTAARMPATLLGPGMWLFLPLSSGAAAELELPWLLEAICYGGTAASDASPAALVAMWSLMAAAMMAPSAVPVLRAYWDLSLGNPSKILAVGFYALIAGFLTVWSVFSVFGAAAQRLLSDMGLLSVGGVIQSDWLSAALLLLSGAYQFSPLKDTCLSRCRSPMAFFVSYWREGTFGAYRMGLRQGVYCVGCCGALMALAFVGGTMNLVWMGVGMVFMTLEKLPALGRYLTQPVGLILICAAVWVAYGSVAGM